MNKEDYRQLANVNFIRACEGLARAFCDQLDISHRPENVWWIDYGGTFAFNCGEMFVNAADMMLVVEHKLTWEQFSEFYDQWVSSEGRINLNSWLMGARPEMTTDNPTGARSMTEEESKAMIETLTVRTPVNSWISVDERLPEDDSCFYFVADARLDPLVVDCAEYTTETKRFSRNGKVLHPTHWCEIPQLNP